MPAVSVIIPVYKVEKFIERCATSLLGQTLEDVEFIFVDDASPDRSIEVLKEVISRFPDRNVTIVTNDTNKGLPAARNTGLAHATGEYVYHCDSDDWVEKNLLEDMFKAAQEKEADMVYCDFFISFEKNERYMHNPEYSTGDELLRRGFLGGMTKYNVWNKLVRRSLYTDNRISFPAGHGMGEDMTMIQLASVSDRVAYVPKALYHYVKLNSEAFSNTNSAKHMEDIKFNMNRTISFLEAKYGNDLEKEMALFKLSNKLPCLVTGDKDQFRLWRELYPEANRYVMASKDVPFRTRLLQWMASKNLWFGVKAYYILVYKVIYGIIYR